MKYFRLLAASLLLLSHAVTARDLSAVFSKVDEAVVVITASESRSIASREGVSLISDSLGSGVIISADGLVLTAAHVVNNADKLKVKLLNDTSYEARVVSSLPPADIALIQLAGVKKKLRHVRVSDSDAATIGSEVFVVGAPYGLEHTLTVGHLSGRRATSGEDQLMALEFLQTDAAVNQGNSGGPLFTADGKLIGIVSHIRTRSGGSEGLGFAASSNMIRRELLEQPQMWFGMDYIPLQGKLAQAMNLGEDEGLLVQRVARGSIGEAFGLVESYIPVKLGGHDILIGGDIILKAGDSNIYMTRAGRERIISYLSNVPRGGELKLVVLRGGKRVELTTSKP